MNYIAFQAKLWEWSIQGKVCVSVCVHFLWVYSYMLVRDGERDF